MRNKPVQEAKRPTTGAQSRIYSRDNVARYAERARQRRRGKTIRRGVLGGLIAVLLVAVVAVGVWFSSVVSRINDSSIINSDLLATLTDSDVAREPFYMLLLGTDGRPGEEIYRTDSIILARIDPVNKGATLISIPRDTHVTYKGSDCKINAVFSYGQQDDGSGAAEMIEAVNELCGVQISEYAEINFQGMEALVDAVGGIDLYIPEGDEVVGDEHLDVDVPSGQQHLDGQHALAFSRSRYIYTDGDYTRMRHQRMVLGALADKILNNLDVTTIPDILNSLADMVHTSLSVTDIVSLVNAMKGMDVDNIYSANVPSYSDESTYIDGQSYVFVLEDDLAAMMERVNAGEDPQGPQTMGSGTGSSATIGDLSEYNNEEWSSGTAGADDASDDTSGVSSSVDTDGDGIPDAYY